MDGYKAALLCCRNFGLDHVEDHITESGNGGHAIYRCRGCGQRWRVQVFVNRDGPTIDTFDPDRARIAAGIAATEGAEL